MAVPLPKGPFTVDEYYRLGEIGILGPDDRVELINGQIVRMTPIGPEHAGCVDELARLFAERAGASVIARVQNPVAVHTHAEPQPDIAVVRRRPEGYRVRHPEPDDVLLVVEVADTSVAYDRDTKFPLYAAAGIPEAWLVNLPADRIEVHTKPGPDGYADVRMAQRGETLSPLLLDGVTLQVNEILG